MFQSKQEFDEWFKSPEAEAFGAQDVTLTGNFNMVPSRLLTSPLVKLQGKKRIPIINANMANLASIDLMMALLENDCFACSSRFHWQDPKYVKKLRYLILKRFFATKVKNLEPLFFSFGLSTEDFAVFEKHILPLYTDFNNILKTKKLTPVKPYILLDIAHGNSASIYKRLAEIKEVHSDSVKVIIGNFFGHDVQRAIDNGADGIRVGIGQGGSCLTTNVTGFGLPTLTSVYIADKIRRENNLSSNQFLIIADGGVAHPSDVVKHLYFGADIVTLGTMLSSCKETPGKVKRKFFFGKPYKFWYGMSSHKHITETKGTVREGISSEGLVKKVYIDSSVSDKVELITSSLRSAMTYAGVFSLAKFAWSCPISFVSNTISTYHSGKAKYL